MGMSVGGGGRKRAMMSEINVTPMVDVMLVLLVIFMVTAPLMQEGIKVNLPKSDAGNKIEAEEKNVTMSIDKTGKLFIEQAMKGEKSTVQEVPTENLEDYLKKIYQTRADRKIFVKADAGVDYGAVVAAISKAKAAGVEQLGLETAPTVKPPPKPKEP